MVKAPHANNRSVRTGFAGLVSGIVIGSIITATVYAWPKATNAMDPATSVIAKAAKIDSLKERYNQMDELCRGGGGSESLTLDACDAREKVSEQMKTMGYCYGSYDPETSPESDRTYDFYACETLRRKAGE